MNPTPFNTFDSLKYKYLSLMLGGVVVAILLGVNQHFHDWVIGLGRWEYLAAFVAGTLFVSSFTVPTSMVVIGVLSENIHPLLLASIGGLGAMLGDLLVFKYIKEHLISELKMLVGKEEVSHIRLLGRSKYIAWTLPIIGALVIASPLAFHGDIIVFLASSF